ncbi:MAG: PD-(D/E)XK nuclease family protein [Gammaproteobacteria bacterium]|nr:PD-(D/E)XK nuclease family protein [Gammaproteobacteria bacterium]
MSISRFDISPLRSALDEGAVILVPNHRIRDAIVDSYSKESSVKTWRTPLVFAIDIWLKQLWDSGAAQGIPPFAHQQLLGRIEELYIWTGIIEKSLDRIPLINPDETAVEVNHAYQQLRQWLPDKSDNEKLQSFSGIPDIAEFLNWKKQYRRLCQKNQLISLVDCIHEIVSEIDKLAFLLPEKIVLANFSQPPPLYRNLFDALGRQLSIRSVSCNASDSTCSCTREEFTDLDQEINACIAWAKEIIRNQPQSHIGILFNSDDRQRSRLQRLFADSLDPLSILNLATDSPVFNTTRSNQSLSDTPLVYEALMLLGLNNEQQQSNSLCRILQSPHSIAYEKEKEARIQLELFMRKNLAASCTVAEFVRHMSQEEKPWQCPELARAILKTRTRLRESPRLASASAWASLFGEQLEILGWPGTQTDLTSTEKTQLKQWQEAMALFSQATVALGKLSLSSALSRLATACSHTRLKAPFDRRCQLSLYTINEAMGLKFDYVWMLGVDDQSWPPRSSPSSFLPYSLQQEAEIPGSHANVQYEMARETFELLCHSVSTGIVASYHTNDADQQLRPSRFILPFTESQTEPTRGHPLNALATSNLASYKIEQLDDCNSFPLLQDENPRGGYGIISNQSSCPFRAFSKHRLQAEPLEDFASGLNSRARGTAIHLALEHVFSHIDSREKLLALSEPEELKLTDQATATAIDRLVSKYPGIMTPGFKEIERQRISTLLGRFLQLEKQRHDFSVIATEQYYQWQQGPLEIRLKVDRIDGLDDGSVAVIDYKTGKTSYAVQKLLEDRPEDMQLPVYYTVVSSQQQQAVSTVSIGHVNVEKIAYTGTSSSDSFHASIKPFNADGKGDMNWSDLTRSWQQKMEQFADEFIEGIAPVAPVNGSKTCRYCRLQGLCRIQEIDREFDMAGADQQENQT